MCEELSIVCQLKEFEVADAERMSYAAVHHLKRTDRAEIEQIFKNSITSGSVEQPSSHHSSSTKRSEHQAFDNSKREQTINGTFGSQSCTQCGSKVKTDPSKPLCLSCWRKSNSIPVYIPNSSRHKRRRQLSDEDESDYSEEEDSYECYYYY